MSRLGHSEALLGPELFKKVRETPILVIGAGGIGCELLKNLVLVGFSNIEIIDLDTIDLSNLNRQFLFRKPDISKSKALVAAATAHHFNPSSGIKIHARHGNVKDGQNDVEWIKSFGLVLNALDNMDARRHVNRLCSAGGVPLMESGTAGYLGQVTPIMRDETECYDCVQKPTPKSFPVCTIRSTPSEPIHCIVWAKSYLFGKLFGEDDEATDEDELNKAQQSGENAEEIQNLRKEAAAFREVRKQLGEEDGPRRVFQKIFEDDINRLLAMDDMWKVAGRVKPVALDYDSVINGTFVTPPLRTAAAPPNANGSAANGTNGAEANGASSSTIPAASAAPAVVNSSQLKDLRELSVKDNLELFLDSCRRLSARVLARPDVMIEFDKDDDDTLDFVLATANLRAIAYGIPNKTRFQVKEMAGNIIPAIATTNAIIAGLIVMQALNLLSKKYSSLKNVFLKAEPSKPLGLFYPQKPDPACAVCRDIYVPLKADVGRLTLGEFVEYIVKAWLPKGLQRADGDDSEVEWSVFEGSRILADPDFEDNHDKTLAELGVSRGKMVTVRDEDEVYRPIQFCLCELEPNATASYSLPEAPPSIPRRPVKAVVENEDSDDGVEAVEIVPSAGAAQPLRSGVKRGVENGDGDVSLGEEGRKKRRVGEPGKEVVVDISNSNGADDQEIQMIE